MEVIHITVAGAAGRMGNAVITEITKSPGFEVAGLYERSGHDSIGREIAGVTISDSVEKAARTADVIVDFTSPEATLANARYCSGTGKAMVVGTTGFSPGQKKEMIQAAEKFPCVIAPNMSIGINLLEQMVSFASQKLGEDFEIEVMEIHHSAKMDAPSGTALALARAAAAARNENLEKVASYGRKGNGTARGKNEIGIQSVRGGDTPGDHTVFFLGKGERVEISHRAHGREIFATGAVRAAKWVCGKPSGVYGMKEVLELRN